MEILKKILLIIYAFIIAIISAVLIGLPFSSKFLNKLYTFLDEKIYYSFISKLITFLIVTIFFISSVYLLFSSIKKNKQSLSVRKMTDLGELSISLASIESLAITSLKNTKGIKEIKVDTEKFGEGVNVILRLVVYPEVIVTEMTKMIQSTVKSDIETTTGIKVMKVIVKIENITSYTMRSAAD